MGNTPGNRDISTQKCGKCSWKQGNFLMGILLEIQSCSRGFGAALAETQKLKIPFFFQFSAQSRAGSGARRVCGVRGRDLGSRSPRRDPKAAPEFLWGHFGLESAGPAPRGIPSTNISPGGRFYGERTIKGGLTEIFAAGFGDLGHF